MAIADLFSSSFLFSVAIILLVAGGLYFYVSYKMTEQDHKISSMLSLVKTMAGEVQYLRSRGGGQKRMDTIDEEDYEDNEGEDDGGNRGKREDQGPPMTMDRALSYYDTIITKDPNSDLVDVSDGEYEDESGSESGSDDDSSAYDDSVDDEGAGVAASLSIEDSDSESIGADDINDLDNLDESIHNSEFNTKTIHLEGAIDIDISLDAEEQVEELKGDLTQVPIPHIEELSDSLVDDIVMPSASAESENDITEKPDYKKLSLNKLREVVVEQGLITDASKLKKGELLKMLGSE